MKKSLFIFSFLLVISTFVACSKKPTTPILLSDDIVTFLQKEGYNTERRGADSLFIAFDKDDENYFVVISDSDTNPLYLRIGKLYPCDSIITKEKVENAVLELSGIKAVKVDFIDDGIFCFGIEFFLADTEHFKATFDKHIEIIDACIGVLQDTVK